MKSLEAMTMGSDAVVGDVGDTFGVMKGVRVPVGLWLGAAVTVGLGVNVFGCAPVGMEVVVDVRVDMSVGTVVAVEGVPLTVMTNWGAKPAAPCVDE